MGSLVTWTATSGDAPTSGDLLVRRPSRRLSATLIAAERTAARRPSPVSALLPDRRDCSVDPAHGPAEWIWADLRDRLVCSDCAAAIVALDAGIVRPLELA